MQLTATICNNVKPIEFYHVAVSFWHPSNCLSCLPKSIVFALNSFLDCISHSTSCCFKHGLRTEYCCFQLAFFFVARVWLENIDAVQAWFIPHSSWQRRCNTLCIFNDLHSLVALWSTHISNPFPILEWTWKIFKRYEVQPPQPSILVWSL